MTDLDWVQKFTRYAHHLARKNHRRYTLPLLEIDDLFQTAMLGLIQGLRSDRAEDMEAYLMGCMRFAVWDINERQFRSRYTDRIDDLEYGEESERLPYETPDIDNRIHVIELMAALNAREREFVETKYFEGHAAWDRWEKTAAWHLKKSALEKMRKKTRKMYGKTI